MSSRKLDKLTAEHAAIILEVEDGADITGYGEAKLLREVEATEPSFIEVTKVMGEYSVSEKLPYFGCIATPAGMKWARGFKS